MTGLWEELEAMCAARAELESDEITAAMLVERTGCSVSTAERVLKDAWLQGKATRRFAVVGGKRAYAYREK